MRERFRLIAESSMIRGHGPASVADSDLATRAGLAAGPHTGWAYLCRRAFDIGVPGSKPIKPSHVKSVKLLSVGSEHA
ncbi:hypothetical protein SSPO_020130 [Streptomyces antimycoticus]|uniref:Uncharacterized protein n=1 Tax=Streptomyces antimycoticus TaxID=68175 RepID=A0A499UD82_9ACTN|nr:hypothetical protein SSPO_020130 [Streptomyces antimycoticus]